MALTVALLRRLLKKKAEFDRLEEARFRSMKRRIVIAAIAGIVAALAGLAAFFSLVSANSPN